MINQRSIKDLSWSIHNHRTSTIIYCYSYSTIISNPESRSPPPAVACSSGIQPSIIPSPYKANGSRVHRSGVAEAADSQKSSQSPSWIWKYLWYLWSIINCKTDIHGYPSYLHHGLCFTICWTRDFPWDEISGIPIMAYDGHWTLEDRQHVELLPSRQKAPSGIEMDENIRALF